VSGWWPDSPPPPPPSRLCCIGGLLADTPPPPPKQSLSVFTQPLGARVGGTPVPRACHAFPAGGRGSQARGTGTIMAAIPQAFERSLQSQRGKHLPSGRRHNLGRRCGGVSREGQAGTDASVPVRGRDTCPGCLVFLARAGRGGASPQSCVWVRDVL
jgi:hypothetical protein